MMKLLYRKIPRVVPQNLQIARIPVHLPLGPEVLDEARQQLVCRIYSALHDFVTEN